MNAAVTGWLLLGPLLLGLRAPLGRRAAGGVRALAWRMALLNAVARACGGWCRARAGARGADFLRFTEQPGTIWSTTSLSESLRLMGYWICYLGVGYGGRLRPLFGDGGVLLFSCRWSSRGCGPGARADRLPVRARWRYGPFFLLLTLVGLLVMTVGFPEGTPLRRAMNFTYYHVASIQFLRTTYKAGALLALGLAVLGGAASRAAGSAPPRGGRGRGRPSPCALAALAAWPLVSGRRPTAAPLVRLLRRGAAPAHLDRTAAATRARSCSGQRYAYYAGAGRSTRSCPRCRAPGRGALGRPVLRPPRHRPAVDGRRPGQPWRALRPARAAARPDGRGASSAADDDRSRSGEAPAGDAADVLDRQLGQPDHAWGPARGERARRARWAPLGACRRARLGPRRA